MPFFSRTDAFVSPHTITDPTSASVVKSSHTSFGSLVATKKSKSCTTSLARRNDPATATKETSGCSRKVSRISETKGVTEPSKNESANFSFKAIASRIAAWVLAPKPGKPATFPTSHAALRSETPPTPSSRCKALTFFGPNP